MEESIVYFTKEITDEKLVELYDKLSDKKGEKVAIKIHSGEAGNQNYLQPEYYKKIVEHVGGTVVECNTAYDGERNTSEKHLKLLDDHGWTKEFKFDLLDEEGEYKLPVENGKHLKINYVGGHMPNYKSMLVLSHFKGHPMGGFGGALKNISIGLASSHGKAVIHGAGVPEDIWTADHDSFLESMAEASKTIIDYYKDNIVFINTMKNMSVDCDCCAVAEDPCMKDIGILASNDPVALDQACIDLILKSDDEGKEHFMERVNSRNGIHTIETAEKLGVGTRKYKLISID